tara:strand:+ start:4278 stop:4793 length:516 start_codon:yes stop_codon:yes gene_type:complete
MKIKLIVAYCKGNGIGHKGCIPWHHSEDLKYFSKKTKGMGNNAIIMGKTTYESIGRTLPKRYNIILSSTFNNPALNINRSLEDAIKYCEQKKFTEVWIIGGERVYREALDKNLIDEIHTSVINEEWECDRIFPKIPNYFKEREKIRLNSLVEVIVYDKLFKDISTYISQIC